MTVINEVAHRLVLDSRGNPTVECEVWVEGGFGRAAAPSGASTGTHEVPAWPEGGAPRAIELAPELALALQDADSALTDEVDGIIEDTDGTPNLSRLGGSLCVATSLAAARAAADALGWPLMRFVGGSTRHGPPAIFANLIGGGAHAVNGTDIQEFMAIAEDANVQRAVMAVGRAHKIVGERLRARLPGTALGKGDEGAWVAPIRNEEALEVLVEALAAVEDETGVELSPALDVAATELWDGHAYAYREGKRTSDEQVQWLAGLVDAYGIASIEDPCHEEDWDGFGDLTDRIGEKCLVVGDDLFATSTERILRGLEVGSANAVLIKPNQVGTLTRTLGAVDTAHRSGWVTIMSHRSGETTDDTIAHLAWGLGCYGIKCGAVGGERIAKLNELIRLQEL